MWANWIDFNERKEGDPGINTSNRYLGSNNSAGYLCTGLRAPGLT